LQRERRSVTNVATTSDNDTLPIASIEEQHIQAHNAFEFGIISTHEFYDRLHRYPDTNCSKCNGTEQSTPEDSDDNDTYNPVAQVRRTHIQAHADFEEGRISSEQLAFTLIENPYPFCGQCSSEETPFEKASYVSHAGDTTIDLGNVSSPEYTSSPIRPEAQVSTEDFFASKQPLSEARGTDELFPSTDPPSSSSTPSVTTAHGLWSGVLQIAGILTNKPSTPEQSLIPTHQSEVQSPSPIQVNRPPTLVRRYLEPQEYEPLYEQLEQGRRHSVALSETLSAFVKEDPEEFDTQVPNDQPEASSGPSQIPLFILQDVIPTSSKGKQVAYPPLPPPIQQTPLGSPFHKEAPPPSPSD